VDALVEHMLWTQAHLRERYRHGAVDGSRLLLEVKVGGIDVDAADDEVHVRFGAVINPHEVGKDQVAGGASSTKPDTRPA
jgi:hypothetical protein